MYCFHQFRLDIKELQSDRMLPVQESNSGAAEFVEKNNLFYCTKRQIVLLRGKNRQAPKHFT